MNLTRPLPHALVTLSLSLLLGLGGCKKKQPIPKICHQTHQHVVTLLQKEHAALPQGNDATAPQKKQRKRLAALLKNLQSKRGKERSLVRCQKTSKAKAHLQRHQCALQAKTTEAVRRCYQPSKKPSQTKKTPAPPRDNKAPTAPRDSK